MRVLHSLAALALSSTALAGDTLLVPSQYATIQAAVDAAVEGDTVLVAPGVYKGPGNRSVDLGSKDLVITSEAGPERTILRCQGKTTDPQRGFLVEGGQSSATLIEGFTIRGGATELGAVSDPFNGGAIRITNSSPVIRDCHFIDNLAGCWGGALFIGHSGSPLIENCLFQDNLSLDGGGGIFSWNGERVIVRGCVFVGNEGTSTGGAILHFSPDSMLIESCTITGNSSNWGTGLAAWPADVRNTIIWGNSGTNQMGGSTECTVSYSCVQDGLGDATWDRGGNIFTDPRLSVDGWHLTSASPCKQAADPKTQPAPGAVDMDGEPREMGHLDIGADEFWSRSTSFR